jgi:aconitate hydratase
VKVSDIEGLEIHQSYIGSSANPGWRDFAIAAEIVRGRIVPPQVSFDVNPTSRDLLQMLIADGHLQALVSSGARIHQAGCNGCIGMGQAPAKGRNSLRTTPRNFPGRSGTREDSVFLCSPETAAASALAGRITDPRSTSATYPKLAPKIPEMTTPHLLVAPPPIEQSRKVELVKGPNIHSLPQFDELPDTITLPVLLKMGDDVSTDEILPAGARVLPYRSNIQKIDDFSFERIDPTYLERARAVRRTTGHAVAAGENYGQGSSREHAALAPRNLGLRIVLAKSFARIHRQNLINYGVLPLTFAETSDYDRLQQGDVLKASALRRGLRKGGIVFQCRGQITARHNLSPRELDVVLAGGMINWRRTSASAA